MPTIKLIILILSFYALQCKSLSANILAIVPTPSYSHQIALWPVWKALSQRGHNITLITTDPDPSMVNITQIDISHTYEIFRNNDLTKMMQEPGKNFFKLKNQIFEMTRNIETAVFEHPKIQQLIHGDDKFDLVISEIWSGIYFAFAHRFNASSIAISSIDATSLFHDSFGNPTNPVLYPGYITPFEEPNNFFERVINVITFIFEQINFNLLFELEEEFIAKYFGEGYPTIKELIKNLDLVFTNTDNIFHKIRPLVPGVIKIGGGLHIQEQKPLPEDLQQFLDAGTNGVVYFSLGSNVKSTDLSPTLKQVISETFSELPYKVLWKFDEEELVKKSDNVKIVKWIPQQDVLRHPNIKVFITQGGAQSIEESIYSNVPMVGMPFFVDQPTNVQKIVKKGIALSVDHHNLDKETFKNVILEVASNKIYREKLKQLAELALDEPMTPKEKVVWWTEYVLRHKGAKHLKSSAANLPFYQFYLLDVIGSLMLAALIIIFILVKISKCMLRYGKSLFWKTKID